ncbi:hypothetical protein ANO11243_006320 [Dothideomycetidae sp. 11243]|nr:hypothetical protein ANO11243_006320 [fungal sp. No.11243]
MVLAAEKKVRDLCEAHEPAALADAFEEDSIEGRARLDAIGGEDHARVPAHPSSSERAVMLGTSSSSR